MIVTIKTSTNKFKSMDITDLNTNEALIITAGLHDLFNNPERHPDDRVIAYSMYEKMAGRGMACEVEA